MGDVRAPGIPAAEDDAAAPEGEPAGDAARRCRVCEGAIEPGRIRLAALTCSTCAPGRPGG